MLSMKQTALYNKYGNAIPAKTLYININMYSTPKMDSVFELAKTYGDMTSNNFAQIYVYGPDAFRLGALRSLVSRTSTGNNTIKTKCKIKNASIKNMEGGLYGQFNTNTCNAKKQYTKYAI